MCEKRNQTMIFATDFFFSTKTLYLCFLIFLSTIFAIFAIFYYSDLLEQIVPTAKHENVVNRFFFVCNWLLRFGFDWSQPFNCDSRTQAKAKVTKCHHGHKNWPNNKHSEQTMLKILWNASPSVIIIKTVFFCVNSYFYISFNSFSSKITYKDNFYAIFFKIETLDQTLCYN
jgi:hypothetical protein